MTKQELKKALKTMKAMIRYIEQYAFTVTLSQEHVKLLESYPTLLLQEEVCDILRINHQTLKRWRKTGKIQSINLLRNIGKGANYRYPKSEVVRILSQEVIS